MRHRIPGSGPYRRVDNGRAGRARGAVASDMPYKPVRRACRRSPLHRPSAPENGPWAASDIQTLGYSPAVGIGDVRGWGQSAAGVVGWAGNKPFCSCPEETVIRIAHD